VFVARD